MASILRQIVAGPRTRHPEAGLDLCYVTDDSTYAVVVTSGPSSTYPQRAYRNPTDALVAWLDSKHGAGWAIWEFRAEGTGYPDSEVHGRILHYPWPDHHPPPFALVPGVMASMRDWLRAPDATGASKDGRVVVLHCKAGKGRSGTMAAGYLVSQEGWSLQDALARFTARRMRAGFGDGVSIPSQLRWLAYVDRWTRTGKRYVEREAEVLEVHAWGLREGVKVAVEGYVEAGRKIETFHTFAKAERLTVAGPPPPPPAAAGTPGGAEHGGKAVLFRPSARIVLPTSDVCVDFERRTPAAFGYTMVTAVAHVWFNVFFEGLARPPPPDDGDPVGAAAASGVFEIAWDAMDGIKGSSRKGARAFDRLAVVWRALDREGGGRAEPVLVEEPKPGEPVPEMRAADWQGEETKVGEGAGGRREHGEGTGSE